jgi:hypothetical protein
VRAPKRDKTEKDLPVPHSGTGKSVAILGRVVRGEGSRCGEAVLGLGSVVGDGCCDRAEGCRLRDTATGLVMETSVSTYW